MAVFVHAYILAPATDGHQNVCLYSRLFSFLEGYFELPLLGSPPKKLPDEPPSSQATGGGGGRNRDREKALIISP